MPTGVTMKRGASASFAASRHTIAQSGGTDALRKPQRPAKPAEADVPRKSARKQAGRRRQRPVTCRTMFAMRRRYSDSDPYVKRRREEAAEREHQGHASHPVKPYRSLGDMNQVLNCKVVKWKVDVGGKRKVDLDNVKRCHKRVSVLNKLDLKMARLFQDSDDEGNEGNAAGPQDENWADVKGEGNTHHKSQSYSLPRPPPGSKTATATSFRKLRKKITLAENRVLNLRAGRRLVDRSKIPGPEDCASFVRRSARHNTAEVEERTLFEFYGIIHALDPPSRDDGGIGTRPASAANSEELSVGSGGSSSSTASTREGSQKRSNRANSDTGSNTQDAVALTAALQQEASPEMKKRKTAKQELETRLRKLFYEDRAEAKKLAVREDGRRENLFNLSSGAYPRGTFARRRKKEVQWSARARQLSSEDLMRLAQQQRSEAVPRLLEAFTAFRDAKSNAGKKLEQALHEQDFERPNDVKRKFKAFRVTTDAYSVLDDDLREMAAQADTEKHRDRIENLTRNRWFVDILVKAKRSTKGGAMLPCVVTFLKTVQRIILDGHDFNNALFYAQVKTCFKLEHHKLQAVQKVLSNLRVVLGISAEDYLAWLQSEDIPPPRALVHHVANVKRRREEKRLSAMRFRGGVRVLSAVGKFKRKVKRPSVDASAANNKT